jgi:hypothetical protein
MGELIDAAALHKLETDGSNLIFLTHSIAIEPATSTTRWVISRGLEYTGNQIVVLVAGRYYLQDRTNGGGEFFTVLDPCEVYPANITSSGDVITLACELVNLDSDEDGIDDVDDNCPLFPMEIKLIKILIPSEIFVIQILTVMTSRTKSIIVWIFQTYLNWIQILMVLEMLVMMIPTTME